MRYEHDPKKLAMNVASHRVWFHEANEFEWETAVIEHDCRKQYAETRFCATGLIGTRLYVLIFCLRETKMRIISMRKANPREVRYYVSQN